MQLPVDPCAGCVLVVEDEVILRLDIADRLRSSGFTVLEALNGDHALIILNTAAESVALVITDMRMPGQTDGVALVSWLRREKPHIKVIVVSGNMAVDKLSNAGARFSKPLDMEALVRQVRHLLNGKTDWTLASGRTTV